MSVEHFFEVVVGAAPAARRPGRRRLGVLASLAMFSAVAAREPELAVSLPIAGPAPARIAAAQPYPEETYPAIYVLDRDSQLVAYAGATPQIEAALATLAAATPAFDAARDGPHVLERLRIPPDRIDAARAVVRAHARTVVLLRATPCPTCAAARAAVLRGSGYAVIEVEHRPRIGRAGGGRLTPRYPEHHLEEPRD